VTDLRFSYRAIRPDGGIEQGTLDVETPALAGETLARRGLFPIEVRAAQSHQERRATIGSGDLALGLRILADLLESGLPVSRALQAFEELAPAGWRSAMPHLRQSIREGKSLASALANLPLEIPPLVIGIAQAGEAGAGIGPAMRRAAEIAESTAATRSALRSALAYPLVVAAAGAAAIAVLIGVVLPRFASILADLGQQLPATTRFVLSSAIAARAAAMPALVALIVLIALWRAWVATPSGHRRWHELLLAIPVVGTARAAAATARATSSLSALLESGVPISQALGFSARATGDAALEARIFAARERITTGFSIAKAFEQHRAVTPTAVRLARAGEESGRLTAMLAHAAKLEQDRADRIVRTAVRMLEPVLLITFASIVAFVAAALLQAIYSVRPTA
jgi:type II secretory pathway component PulF